MDVGYQPFGSCIHRMISKGSTIICLFNPTLSHQSSYLPPMLEVVEDYFVGIEEKVSSNSAVLKAQHLNWLCPCPNLKAKKYYRDEEDPTFPVLHLPPVARDFVKEHHLSSGSRINVKFTSCMLEVLEVSFKSLIEMTS